jgi:hypothetical protein
MIESDVYRAVQFVVLKGESLVFACSVLYMLDFAVLILLNQQETE